ncbi:MAG: pyruvate ferredoxin oxidoreductase [Desulfarculaceae bacterium]|nr:pyruvate ferredoxin oxidoreductase [Desulfarculaceae bacterium]MCF8046075.1 pyruvate ferredoxin oxidoreductase [Desulfarculaceae bacterium]MCF8064793.1 pyruvate ferredoxin oxidoreductase [Desulfarculaceae bacterium]MCF8121247.1 pyruvate ferredoxin oxidoreductase [Desulfarculaceae bacterium]
MKRVIMGTETAALAAVLARVQVVAAYPITPQTVTVEELSDYIGKGELDAAYITVESEHSAMAACVGASATGSRTFTATSSQGLALMHEMLHHAAGGRLPIVMLNANRALSPPWNLYCDHTDSLSQRDTGWIQYYCCDVQDVMDSTFIAYRVAEKVMLPVMINLDGFYLTHTSEVIDVPDQEEVDRYLPPYDPADKVDVDNPSTYGCVCGADLFSSLKYRRQMETLAVEQAWQEASDEFAAQFGRSHAPVQGHNLDDAEVVIVTIGTAGGAAQLAADALREEGVAAGSLNLAMVRPFPYESFRRAVSGAKHLVVLDRDVSFGAEGIVAQEVKSCLYGKSSAQVHCYIAGVGGMDITEEILADMARESLGGQKQGLELGDSIWIKVLP